MKNNKTYILKEVGTKEKYTSITILESLITLTMVMGIILSYKQIFYSNICFYVSFFTSAIILFANTVSEIRIDNCKLVKTVTYIFGAVLFVIFAILGTGGLLDLINRIILVTNDFFTRDNEYYAISGNVILGSIILWILIAEILTYIILRSVKKRNFANAIILSFIALFIGLFFDKSIMWVPVVLIIVSIVSMFLLYSTPQRKFGVKFHEYIIALYFVLIVVVFATANYNKVEIFEKWKAGVADNIDKIRYGEDTLPNGEFSKADKLLDGDETRLHIKMDNPQELYLKGFVGGTYNEKGWKPISQQQYHGKYDGMLEWLKKNKFDIFKQYVLYQKLGENLQIQSKVSVENIAAYRKYVYMPATVSQFNENKYNLVKDYRVQGSGFFGSKNYDYSIIDGAPTADGVIQSEWINDANSKAQLNYIETEAVYQGFVLDKYTNVNNNVKNIINTYFYQDNVNNNMDFGELTTWIRQVLKNYVEYTDKPKNVPKNRDLIQWTLEDYQKGNAVSFASIAVMAYRCAGYPARYVEGYHLSGEEVTTALEKKSKEINLTSKNAHVWVEVYIDGIGWLPVEVVPGMYIENITNELVEGTPIYKIQSQDDKNGIESVTDSENKKENKKDTDKNATINITKVVSYGMNTILVILYLILALYLILELQRFVRIKLEESNSMKKENPVDYYTVVIGRILTMKGIRPEYTAPMDLYVNIKMKFQGIKRDEYKRVVSLIEKNKYGGKELQNYEIYVLESFYAKLKRIMYYNAGLFDKFKFRYIYALKIK